jgi:type II secretory pathway component PulJ
MNTPRKAFTLTELLISVGIFALIGGGVIIAMSRGASNVHRGSFNATASNQAAWIISMMRRDIARSDFRRIKFTPDSGTKWQGSGEFSLLVNGGEKINYSIESRGSGKAFCRAVEGGQ